MSGGMRVIVFYRAPSDDPGAVARAYARASADLAGTPGLVRNELLRDMHAPESYAVLSEWKDRSTFLTWEQGADHARQTGGLRPFRHNQDRSFAIYEIVAER